MRHAKRSLKEMKGNDGRGAAAISSWGIGDEHAHMACCELAQVQTEEVMVMTGHGMWQGGHDGWARNRPAPNG